MTITKTEGWRKAVEAAQDAIDNWARHNLNQDDADDVMAWSDEMAEAAVKFAIPVYLAALAESAEPLVDGDKAHGHGPQSSLWVADTLRGYLTPDDLRVGRTVLASQPAPETTNDQ